MLHRAVPLTGVDPFAHGWCYMLVPGDLCRLLVTQHDLVVLEFPAGTHLFVHGGRNNFVLEDLFVLDLVKKEWTDVGPGSRTPPPRHGHLMTVHADKLYMYGGYDELGAWSDAMFCLPVPYDQPFTAARYAALAATQMSQTNQGLMPCSACLCPSICPSLLSGMLPLLQEELGK